MDYDSFFETDISLSEFTNEKIIYTVASKDFNSAPSFHGCPKLENALFISFINMLDAKNLNINKCENCGKLFIPTSKRNEKYCNNTLKEDSSRTCKDVGADRRYKNKLKDNEITKLIRDTSALLGMRVKRCPDLKVHQTRYDNWKKNKPIQMKKYEQGKITKDEFINWINDMRR